MDAFVPLVVLTAPIWIVMLRHSVAQLLETHAVAPDVVAAAAAAVAWTRSPSVAIAFAAVLGGAADLASATPWGLYAVRLALLAAVLSHLRCIVALDGLPGAGLGGVVTFAVAERCLAVLTLKVWIPEADLAVLLPRAVRIGVFTAVLAPIALAVAWTLAPSTRLAKR